MSFDSVSSLVEVLRARKSLRDRNSKRLPRDTETPDAQNLTGLIHRLQTLHIQTKSESIISAETISQGVQLWQDIDNWDGLNYDSPTIDPELTWLYKSSLFIWLHLIIYPRSMDDAKVQQLVAPGINYLKHHSESQLPAVLLLPIFFHGLGSNEKVGRQMTLLAFSHLKSDVDKTQLEICEATLTWSWNNYDKGLEKSWDWTEMLIS